MLTCAGLATADELVAVPTTNCNTNVAINNAVGQSFKVPSDAALDSIEVWIKPNLYYDTTYNVRLYDGEGPSGTLLATSQSLTIADRDGGEPAAWRTFPFSTSIDLQANHTYTLQLTRLSTYSGAFSLCSNIYPDGKLYWLGTSPQGHEDMSFRVNGTVDDGDVLAVELDTRLVGSNTPPVLTSEPLVAGVPYAVTVEGNYSAWSNAGLTPNPCPDQFDIMFPSPSVPGGIYAGVDAEYTFSAPGPGEISYNSARCQTLVNDGPIPSSSLRFSVDGGATFFTPTPLEPDFQPDHVYRYIVTGAGHPAGFQRLGSNFDDHGVFKITITRIRPLDLELDTRLVGSGSPDVLTTRPLLEGVPYVITVDGNYSAWSNTSLTPNPCPAQFSIAFPSPSVPGGIYAGVDAEYTFSAPGPGESSYNSARCQTLANDGPIPLSSLLFSVDGGASYFDPTPNQPGFQPDHIYQYSVTGTGQPAGFQRIGSNSDDHGVFKISITLDPAIPI